MSAGEGFWEEGFCKKEMMSPQFLKNVASIFCIQGSVGCYMLNEYRIPQGFPCAHLTEVSSSVSSQQRSNATLS